jgi:hypothetical protein
MTCRPFIDIMALICSMVQLESTSSSFPPSIVLLVGLRLSFDADCGSLVILVCCSESVDNNLLVERTCQQDNEERIYKTDGLAEETSTSNIQESMS